MDGIDIINDLKLDNNVIADNVIADQIVAPVKGKRGRRSKKEIEMAKALEFYLSRNQRKKS
jgi:hypothetical protein